MKSGHLAFFAAVFLVVFSVFFPVYAQEGRKLNSTEIIQVFSGRTSLCVKEKDQSTCDTFMGERGKVKRLTHKDNMQKTGKWHAAGHTLCILWDGKTRELCFDTYQTGNGDYQLFFRGRLKATVTGFKDGDQSGF